MKMVERLREYSKYAMKGTPGISDTVLVSAQFLTEVAAALEAADLKLAKAAEALEDILAPIAKAQRELEPGQRLNGSAYTILTSAENLREIARTALSQIRSEK